MGALFENDPRGSREIRFLVLSKIKKERATERKGECVHDRINRTFQMGRESNLDLGSKVYHSHVSLLIGRKMKWPISQMKRNEATINQFLKIQIVTLSDRFNRGGGLVNRDTRFTIYSLTTHDVLTREESSDKTPKACDLMKNKFSYNLHHLNL